MFCTKLDLICEQIKTEKMKSTIKKFMIAALAAASILSIQSCVKDTDGYYIYYPNAIVTVKQVPGETGACYLQLDDSTTLIAENMRTSPFGDREVRAIANIQQTNGQAEGYDMVVRVNAIDSILTKSTVPYENDIAGLYGDEPVTMVNDWMTVVEDGYITLRIRVRNTGQNTVHVLNLVTGTTEDPYLVEFRHKIEMTPYPNGMYPPFPEGYMADGLVAFRLDSLPDTNGETVKLTLKWKSFDGQYHTAQFDYCTGKSSPARMEIESEASFLTNLQ